MSHTHTSATLTKLSNLNGKIGSLVWLKVCLLPYMDALIQVPLSVVASRVTVITQGRVSAEAHLAGWCIFDHPFVAEAEGHAGEERRRLNRKESGLFSVKDHTVLQVVTGRAANTKLLGLADLQVWWWSVWIRTMNNHNILQVQYPYHHLRRCSVL